MKAWPPPKGLPCDWIHLAADHTDAVAEFVQAAGRFSPARWMQPLAPGKMESGRGHQPCRGELPRTPVRARRGRWDALAPLSLAALATSTHRDAAHSTGKPVPGRGPRPGGDTTPHHRAGSCGRAGDARRRCRGVRAGAECPGGRPTRAAHPRLFRSAVGAAEPPARRGPYQAPRAPTRGGSPLTATCSHRRI
jgi:hypothetical protein